MKKVYPLTIIGAIIILGWLLISRNGQGPAEDINTPIGQEAQREKAPNFSLQDYNSKTVSLADFAGKPLEKEKGPDPFSNPE